MDLSDQARCLIESGPCLGGRNEPNSLVIGFVLQLVSPTEKHDVIGIKLFALDRTKRETSLWVPRCVFASRPVIATKQASAAWNAAK